MDNERFPRIFSFADRFYGDANRLVTVSAIEIFCLKFLADFHATKCRIVSAHHEFDAFPEGLSKLP